MSALPKTTHPALYRVTQFFAALRAVLRHDSNVTPADQVLVTSILTTSAQQRLFARMSPNDQRHALAVAHTLQQAGYTDLALLQAALLHDVAKSLGQPILHRVLIVLFEAFWPSALIRLTISTPQPTITDSPSSILQLLSSIPAWRKPLVIHAHHPAIGAIWAKEADCESLTVSLIARHQESLVSESASEEEKLLAALQWADNLN